GRVEYQSVHASEFYPRVVALVWEKYEKALRDEKALDFDDLLIKTVELLEQNKSILKKYQNMWKYLSVDEYQDTNGVQNKLTHLLANKHGNICVVGDIDQTIYTWRGANISNLLDFEHKYPNTKIIMLEENYRSTKNILDASNSVIEKNANRPKKHLFTNGEIGEKISLFKGCDEADEARFVTEKSGELINRKVPPREIAVLYRVNFQSRVIEEFFLDCGIPYQVLGVRFFDRKEVKDVLSFLRLALNPESVADLKRVINVPPRGIGKVTLLRMVSGRESECTAAMQKRIGDFRALLSNIQNMVLNQAPSETLRFILKESGLKKHLRDGGEEGQERLLNIQELIALAAKYDRDTPLEGVEKLLTDAALATDQDTLIENTNSVKLMTVHAAKGLEFDYVFITGLEDGLFPHEMFEGLSGSSTRRDEEEERRLFYVALTRARKKIYLSYASVRNVFGARRINVQSEFIGDIPEELLVLENEAVEREKVIYLDLDDE
ncbi:UvrD-helicase domain-containing protein, partial [Patescibacteria group bacterium]|nr:UvrD-helicase domain-containing protein [Patescibacteria group bacterium]